MIGLGQRRQVCAQCRHQIRHARDFAQRLRNRLFLRVEPFDAAFEVSRRPGRTPLEIGNHPGGALLEISGRRRRALSERSGDGVGALFQIGSGFRSMPLQILDSGFCLRQCLIGARERCEVSVQGGDEAGHPRRFGKRLLDLRFLSVEPVDSPRECGGCLTRAAFETGGDLGRAPGEMFDCRLGLLQLVARGQGRDSLVQRGEQRVRLRDPCERHVD